jgi:hypothetical protein
MKKYSMSRKEYKTNRDGRDISVEFVYSKKGEEGILEVWYKDMYIKQYLIEEIVKGIDIYLDSEIEYCVQVLYEAESDPVARDIYKCLNS